MKVTRREFVKGGVAAFTFSLGAPAVLSDLARAQGSSPRNLVVLYLGGGNDALSTVVPYNDAGYRARRPNLWVRNSIPIGADEAGVVLGLHPRLTGLYEIFNEGRLALIQRTGYPNQSRSHFQGLDVWATAKPSSPSGLGWVGRYLDALPQPLDALTGWNTTRDLPRVLQSDHVPVPGIPDPRTYAFASPNPQMPAEVAAGRSAAVRISSHVPIDRPELAFVYGSARAAMATLERVGTVGTYAPTTGVTYPNTGFGLAMRWVAGAMVRQLGTRVFYVTTGGYDTHAGQNPNGGAYTTLMGTLDDGLHAFYRDLKNHGLLQDTLVLIWSEFGRRINENGSIGTDHGAAAVMMAMGGRVNGKLYGSAPRLDDPSNPTLENNGADVRHDIDFRSVYARIIDNWLGGNSVAILGGDFRNGKLTFI